jgi:hypothetical protein
VQGLRLAAVVQGHNVVSQVCRGVRGGGALGGA